MTNKTTRASITAAGKKVIYVPDPPASSAVLVPHTERLVSLSPRGFCLYYKEDFRNQVAKDTTRESPCAAARP